ncbi:MAG TPA: type ISP restriction/modification enzyme [Candidatus Angelobacter sp.]|nr:type ISP restriction/modification enzyme [Candidatus Angelobacter sp.]
MQHLLTERIFRRVFNNPEFTRRNIIAAEIEKVIDSLTSRHFSRDAFLKDLDRFYHAIEINAENATDFSEKQTFLNTVYERFFQGFSPKEADTHGIVYTPQPIVNFMVRSVEEILKKEFGKSLGDREVHILDPFVGTGNFLVRVMQEIPKTRLQYKYENELHCNEVMLLPYYIASMNIEHAYLDATGEYKPFEGICLVDTFELAEASQMPMFTAKNTERVEKQKQAPIFVIIGNPPYRASQKQEDENNRNRSYPALDNRIAETYGEGSEASTVNKSRDPFVRAFRWATDRIGPDGLVCLVTNSSYLDQFASDGIRKSLASEYSTIYLLDLGANIRKNPKISGTSHNVFGIKLGVCIALFVRKKSANNRSAEIFYATINDYWRKEERLKFLEQHATNSAIQWQMLRPDDQGNWLTASLKPEYTNFISIANQETKSGKETTAIFKDFSLGANTNRDLWVYDFDQHQLTKRIKKLAATYNAEVHRYVANGKPANIDDFVINDPKLIQWSSRLKETLSAGKFANTNANDLRFAIYRPYTKMFLQFDSILIHRRGRLPEFLPKSSSENENIMICATGVGAERPFATSATRIIPDLNFYGPGTVPQWVPFYTYAEDGTNRRENITDWGLGEFRETYGEYQITKWDIFHYTYAVLHHPEYRTRYAANLKRELPRIPYAPAFHAFAKAGKRLAELHVDYEKQKEYPLERREKPGEKLNLRVEKMRLSKDKQTLVYNDFLTLTGIPKETYDYRLGNRSALEWVIDQYQVSTDKRSGITNDPNRDDDKEYILRLIGQVITVSLETVKIVNALPDLGLPNATPDMSSVRAKNH